MYFQAKELLRNHKDLLLRKGVLEMIIASMRDMEDDGRDETIDAMALGRRLTGMPPSGRHGSNTEYIALNYRDVALAEAVEAKTALRKAENELRRINIELNLYNAVLKSLSEAEQRFVELHYVNNISINRIAGVSLLPDIPSSYAASTLRRMNAAILKRVDKLVGELLKSVQS